ncbi:MAG TPA: hypothetical protein VM409_05560, partial [Chloroflexia bacterium]|nr:hypothetical protein [Chloroflexia bacterium]
MTNFPNDISDVPAKISAALPDKYASLLESAARLAEAHGWTIYLVGGYIRDCLLGVLSFDIDISVEGDALTLATEVASETGGQVEGHDQFSTATVKYPDSFDLDIVTARRESYPRPGVLPVVEAGTIADDLARRDFSINALAVRLTRSGPSELLDPFGGRGDLQAKQVRVLHSASFRDDPTRIFRAVKIARRLGFTIEKATLELILQAVRDGALYTVSVDRVTRELLFIMGEEQGDAMLADLHHLGVLQAVHPLLEWPYEPGQVRPYDSATLSTKDRQETYLTAIGADLADPEAAETLARGLNLPTPHVRLLKGGAELGLAWKGLAREELDSWQVYNLLRGIDVKTIEAFARLDLLKQEAVPWQRLTLYLNSLR